MSNLVDFRFIEDYDVDKLKALFSLAIVTNDIENKLKAGSTVLLKAHLPNKADKNTAICTHPAVIQAIVEVLNSYDVNCLLVDSPYGSFNAKNLNEVYYQSGMLEVSNNVKVKLCTNLKTVEKEITDGVKAKTATLLKIVDEVDYIINVGKIKFDNRLGYLGVSTNLFGLVPAELKTAYLNRLSTQKDFFNLAIDINSILKSKVLLNVLDGIVIREQGGTPRMLSAFITGKNCYSVDAFLLNLLNIDYANTIIKLASERGLINYDNPFKQVGDSVSSINQGSILPHTYNLESFINIDNFSTRNYYNKHQQLAVIYPNECKGCGVCSKICPTGAIMMKYDKLGEL